MASQQVVCGPSRVAATNPYAPERDAEVSLWSLENLACRTGPGLGVRSGAQRRQRGGDRQAEGAQTLERRANEWAPWAGGRRGDVHRDCSRARRVPLAP